MILAFTLSMPGCPSWNGRWSGEGRLYAIVKNMGRTQKATAKATEILSKRSYSYHWSDGWAASIDVKEVTPQEARKMRAASVGFSGYNWMVESILRYGKILDDSQRKQEVAGGAK